MRETEGLRDRPSWSAASAPLNDCLRKAARTWRMKAGAWRLDNCWHFQETIFGALQFAPSPFVGLAALGLPQRLGAVLIVLS